MADHRDPPQADDEGDDAPHERHADKPRQVELDDIKEAHTTHWDMDVMPRAELEALYAEQARKKRRRHYVKVAGVVGAILALCSAGGFLVLSAS